MKVPDEDVEFQIAKLTLQPGELLAVRLERAVTSETERRIVAHFRRSLPAGVNIVVLPPDMELTIISKSEAKRAAKASV